MRYNYTVARRVLPGGWFVAVREECALIDNNVILDALGAFIVLIMLMAKRKGKRDEAPSARMLTMLLLLCASVFLLDILGLLLDGCVFPGARALLWLLDTTYWVMHIVYCWLWLVFTDEWNFHDMPALKRRAPLYALPMLCALAIIFTNPLTGWLFVLNEHNVYLPGRLYYPCLAPYYFYIACSVALTLRGYRVSRDPEQRRNSLSMLAYMFLPVCGSIMEWIAYGVSWVWPMTALSLLTLYIGMQQQTLLTERLSVSRAAEKAARMDAEMTSSRMAIMLSQIQPHFLYNALCVIQDLCHGKAPEAETATIAFSRFLRGNLDSLRADKPISFPQELTHTQYYLTLEKMRFGERLKVEYDLRTERFLMPALTLQPIVENAVRYGVMKKEQGGTVTVSTAETPEQFIVTVTDDGVGFDPFQKHEDGRTHIGIDNVRQRLRDMCGGDLLISSVQSEGTIARIVLPKEGNAYENHSG